MLLSFGAGESSKDATVTTLNDTVVENQETFPVQLSNATSSTGSAAITGATANGTINDNDQYSISIAAAPAVVEGGIATFAVTVSPTVQAGDTVTVQYSTLETGSAKAADGDFTAASNVLLSFGAGESSKDATVTTLNDTVVENQETFPVQLSNATSSTGSAAITGATANGTINDNDQYSISIAAAPAVVEGGIATFAVTVSPTVQAGDTVTVQYSTLETGSAKAADGDFTAASNVLLSFGAGESSKDATVTTLNDTVVENQETFPVQLSNATSSTGSAAITGATANGTINDDDSSTRSRLLMPLPQKVPRSTLPLPWMLPGPCL